MPTAAPADCSTRCCAKRASSAFPGAHCYEFFATAPVFAALAEAEPGTFYLTDFLLRHFERLVIRGLGWIATRNCSPTYFGNYRKLVYLAQAPEPTRESEARAIAARMGLEFEYRAHGLRDARDPTLRGGREQGERAAPRRGGASWPR